MRRREFLGGLSVVASWPLTVQAQHGAVPVVGFLRSSTAAPFSNIVAAFRQGLSETGYVDGQSVTIEQRWADNRLDRLPELASDLIRRQVQVIVGNGQAIEAARKVTTSIPMVFVIGDDPVAAGWVASLNRPGGNLTGITFFGNQLAAKRIGLLLELVPTASVLGLLIDANFPAAASDIRDFEEAARSIR